MSRHFATLPLMAVLALASAAPAQTHPPPGECPQPRFTERAPAEYLSRSNPVAADSAVGARLYASATSNTVGCATCHGASGDGRGELAKLFDPPPRNFACARTVRDVPDGQLFWIIRYGSPGTSMPGHVRLKDDEIWQLVHHLRKLAR
ncbi:MAG: cytochrome c [Betaproteobacteria bacterium]|nr:cytochrome c [Betaproteobacteria bacterium]